jgi:glycosyltransferase involved in cell wall biosynthesis
MTATKPFLVSVVIANWNYGRFLGAAIDSALGLDWPDVEVIVVDDGSTDDSREVMNGYGDRIVALFQPQSGQTAACNTGFARARGEVVIFLDSDDLLDRSLVREIAAVWRPGLSKVQFQMKIIDAEGHATGSTFPQYPGVPAPAQIRRWALRAAAYPTAVGSGNAYARSFLDRIFPLDVSERTSDSHCLAAAPYLGDVVTVARPLVSYRIHGRNEGAMSSVQVGRFADEVKRARWRFQYAQGIARSAGLSLPDAVFNNSLNVLPYRLASFRLAPERHPVPRDSMAAIVRDTARAVFVPQGRTVQARVVLLAWCLLVALLPRAASERLVLWRFASTSRPRILRRVLSAFRLVKATGQGDWSRVR